ncbi:MAG: ribosome-associated translation inhibitor RaiA [Blastocatellia bacterium]|nr:ribosome-associated translation inhibitor RaiA [Blastocatellia bacterium]MBK6425299.1 ribosome-associated translation inhibitor RaiA [Blastocatellia bacterium]
MQQPIQISFRNVDPSEAVEANIRSKIDWLETFYDRIQSCRVVIEVPHRHRHQGRIYQVRLDLTVPGAEFVVNREAGLNGAHEDVYVAIRDAFDAARRRVEDYARRQRGETKAHDATARPGVTRHFI